MTAPGRLPLVLGNWKSNLDHEQGIHLVQKLLWTLRDAHFDEAVTEVGVVPPFTALRSVQTLIDSDGSALGLGAQDVSADGEGAHTGEIAASMLAKLGCRFVLVGHSERRAAGESDQAVAAKLRRALGSAMVPVVCVGEPLEVREAGTQVEHVLGQLSAALTGLPAAGAGTLVVAYEPVWAIGTGRTATPDDAQSMAAAIRGRLVELFGDGPADRVRILYGGSVKVANVATLLDGPDVDGALVGGASLDPVEFAGICRFRIAPGYDRAVTLALSIVLVICSFLLIVLILLHKGKGGGLSDLFGGGVTTSLGGSSIAERNLDRITIVLGLVWLASIVALGILYK